MDFRWNDWNIEHVQKHGVSLDEAETLVRTALAPYPQRRDEEKWLVRGTGIGGRLLQAVFVEDADSTIYIIHARPLTEGEKRTYRRRRRRS